MFLIIVVKYSDGTFMVTLLTPILYCQFFVYNFFVTKSLAERNPKQPTPRVSGSTKHQILKRLLESERGGDRNITVGGSTQPKQVMETCTKVETGYQGPNPSCITFLHLSACQLPNHNHKFQICDQRTRISL